LRKANSKQYEKTSKKLEMKNESSTSGVANTFRNPLIWIVILIGIALIAISVALPAGYWHEFLKELGIVLVSAFSVSLIYEEFVTKKLLSQFQSVLKDQLEQIESISAVCARLGIYEIYPTRQDYEIKYPLHDLASKFEPGSEFQVIARSLLLLMTKSESIKTALDRGVNVKFCLFNPNSLEKEFEKLPDLEVGDMTASISTFKKNLVQWVSIKKPQGTLELRYHDVHLFDSYTTAKFDNRFHGAWDLSFGRNPVDKRMIVVESNRGIGADLTTRYDNIWNNAIPVFKYEASIIELNDL